jgi:putative transposase
MRKRRGVSGRAERDEELQTEIRRVREANFGVYGARKVWIALNREGIAVARCTVERLMREMGIRGARRGGYKVPTTVADPSHDRAPDRVDRAFTAARPHRLWVADFTEVPLAVGKRAYVAFVVDVYSRAIYGWAASTRKHTKLVLDAVDHALWQRDRAAAPYGTDDEDLVHYSDAGSQYTSFRFTAHLDAAGLQASIGTVGDAYDNALMESTIGLHKTELIDRAHEWRNLTDVELATAEWIDWYNNQRLHSEIGYDTRPPTSSNTGPQPPQQLHKSPRNQPCITAGAIQTIIYSSAGTCYV